MSELVREYAAHFFDKSKFRKHREDDENEHKAEEDLNLQMNPTSLLHHNSAMKAQLAAQG